MKNTKRILIGTLAMVLVLAVMLTGCKMPKPTFNKIPGVAATYGNGQELTTAQYLAYLAMITDEIYQEKMSELNPYYQYGIGDKDPWSETFSYNGSTEKISLADYILRATQDEIKRQIVLTQMMKDNGLKWIAEDEAEFNESIAGMQKDAFIKLGFNNESYIYVLRNMQLNESSAFYGMYGIGGKHASAVTEEETKNYFKENYLSYKMIAISLTDSNNKELDKEGDAYKQIMAAVNKYMEVYEKEGFDAAYEAYEKDQENINKIKQTEATKTTTTTGTSGTGTGTGATGTGTSGSTTAGTTAATTTTTTTAATTTTTTGDGSTTSTGSTTGTTGAAEEEEEHDHDHRQDVDSSTMDEDVKKAIESVEVGDCKIVELTSASTPYVTIIERLDINKDDEGKEGAVYEEAEENIIYELKYEDFSKEVDAAVKEVKITFNKKVIEYKDCQPYKMYELMQELFA